MQDREPARHGSIYGKVVDCAARSCRSLGASLASGPPNTSECRPSISTTRSKTRRLQFAAYAARYDLWSFECIRTRALADSKSSAPSLDPADGHIPSPKRELHRQHRLRSEIIETSLAESFKAAQRVGEKQRRHACYCGSRHFPSRPATIGSPVSFGTNPVFLTREYETNAHNISRSQAALAAAGLAKPDQQRPADIRSRPPQTRLPDSGPGGRH